MVEACRAAIKREDADADSDLEFWQWVLVILNEMGEGFQSRGGCMSDHRGSFRKNEE